MLLYPCLNIPYVYCLSFSNHSHNITCKKRPKPLGQASQWKCQPSSYTSQGCSSQLELGQNLFTYVHIYVFCMLINLLKSVQNESELKELSFWVCRKIHTTVYSGLRLMNPVGTHAWGAHRSAYYDLVNA